MPKRFKLPTLKRVAGNLGIETRSKRINKKGIRSRDKSWKILTIRRKGGGE
jgi:hypothetical protein